jgi:DNA-binding response OmpR family regulator
MPPPNILIVEDEPILAQNIKAFLEPRVPNVRVVGDGEQALEILASFTPNAVVMDYRLPGMNGLDTYSEMIRRDSRIECVMITGDPEEGLRQCAIAIGIRSVLAKPFSFSELLKRLASLDDPRRDSPAPAKGAKPDGGGEP